MMARLASGSPWRWPGGLLCAWAVAGCLATVPGPDGAAVVTSGDWPVFEGAWFSIAYPPEFAPRPVLAGSDGRGWDSVAFDAPGGEASFYVLSPQWRRDDPALALDPGTEVLVAERRSGEGELTRLERHMAARDGSVRRTVETYVSVDGTVSWSFQLMSRDAAASRAYLPAFRRFKASLTQFAD